MNAPRLFPARPIRSGLAAAALIAAVYPASRAADAVDCRPVVEQLRENVQQAPDHVLTLVEDAVVANGGHCVGALVQVAILASNADGATVKKIVFVAVSNAPKQAPEIAESAVEASPKHADSVRAAFAEAFHGKNPRMKASDPAAMPAWEREKDPVTGPAAPAPAKPAAPPAVAQAGERNPFTDIDGGAADGKWELYHDGVLAGGVQPAAPAPESAPPPIVPPPPLEKTKRPGGAGALGFLIPKLPSLPPLDEPADLSFRSPFGGIPAPGAGS